MAEQEEHLDDETRSRLRFQALKDEIKRLCAWIADLQSGMYINCVYCGHRYGPKDEVPASMADVLKEHIEHCPKHPMSALRTENKRLEEENATYDEALMSSSKEVAALRIRIATVEAERNERAEAARWNASLVRELRTRLTLVEGHERSAMENRNRFCRYINEIAILLGSNKDCNDPGATLRRVQKLKVNAARCREDLAAAEARAEEAEMAQKQLRDLANDLNAEGLAPRADAAEGRRLLGEWRNSLVCGCEFRRILGEPVPCTRCRLDAHFKGLSNAKDCPQESTPAEPPGPSEVERVYLDMLRCLVHDDDNIRAERDRRLAELHAALAPESGGDEK